MFGLSLKESPFWAEMPSAIFEGCLPLSLNPASNINKQAAMVRRTTVALWSRNVRLVGFPEVFIFYLDVRQLKN
jgi:hypothetical protein